MAALRVLVLIGSASLTAGGAERQVDYLLRNMPAERVAFRLACFEASRDDVDRIARVGVAVDILSSTPRRLWPLRFLARVLSIVRRHDIEIVQAFLPTFDILAPTLRLFAPDLRVVTSRRNVDEQLSSGELRGLKITGRLATGIVANSQAVAESVRRIEGDPQGRLHVIPNGLILPPPVDASQRKGARQTLGLADDEFVIVYIAHFRDGKGHVHLPGVVDAVVRRVPHARFLLAGDMNKNRGHILNAAAFGEAVDRLGASHKVRCLGLVPDSRLLLAAADASLNLSDVEGMSNALMESMALGVPVVATEAGGVREMVADGAEGWIIARGDVATAVERLVDLAGAPEIRRRVGEAARARIARDFSIERMVDSYARLYERLTRG